MWEPGCPDSGKWYCLAGRGLALHASLFVDQEAVLAAAVDLQPMTGQLEAVGGRCFLEHPINIATHLVLGGAAFNAQQVVVVALVIMMN